jgi:hypothetical protein
MAKSAIKEIAKLSMENLVSIQTFPMVYSAPSGLCRLGAASVVWQRPSVSYRKFDGL